MDKFKVEVVVDKIVEEKSYISLYSLYNSLGRNRVEFCKKLDISDATFYRNYNPIFEEIDREIRAGLRDKAIQGFKDEIINTEKDTQERLIKLRNKAVRLLEARVEKIELGLFDFDIKELAIAIQSIKILSELDLSKYAAESTKQDIVEKLVAASEKNNEIDDLMGQASQRAIALRLSNSSLAGTD